jgi:3-oxoacyl-[acyl-carrier protein] reductase
MRPRTENGGGTGSIINVSSGAIDLAYPGIGLYAFTKAAVAMLSMTTAKEVGQYGIRVNAIAPGTTITPFTTWRMTNPDRSLNTEVYDAFLDQMKAMSPIGLAGEALDQAMLIHYLASDASKYATGNIFRVNGGQTMMW